jgi:hypothetical protein
MLKIRYIKCGKDCKKCPHGAYVYLQWREGDKIKSQYLGKFGNTKTLQKLNSYVAKYPQIIQEYEKLSATLAEN